ncbi:MAG: phosphatidate cytidylyltransferase [Planctomycetales bacterium]
MSPSAALASTVFRFYAITAIGLLSVAGLAIAILKWGLRKNVDHAWQSYRGWLIMVPVIIGAIFLGREATIIGLTVLSIFATKEFARATGLYQDWLMTGVVYLGIITVGVVSLMHDPFHPETKGWYGLFIACPVYIVAAILLMPILRNQSQGQLQKIALAIVAFVYFGWMFGHLAYLANAQHAYSYLLYLLFAVELNDVAAFTCGKLFGRHPLRSNISPKKTWEGSLGALAVSLLLPWLLWFTFPHFTGWQLVIIGLIVGIGGQLGDLAISVIKRDVGIKDMGALIPGHGGLLDRIDSLIYVAPIFFHFVRWLHDL